MKLPRFLRLATLLDAAETEVSTYLTFPPEHWRQIWSTNPLERFHKEIKHRTDVVAIFPNAAEDIPLGDEPGRTTRRVAGKSPALQCGITRQIS